MTDFQKLQLRFMMLVLYGLSVIVTILVEGSCSGTDDFTENALKMQQELAKMALGDR